jgi:hypothetical protein
MMIMLQARKQIQRYLSSIFIFTLICIYGYIDALYKDICIYEKVGDDKQL